MCTIPDKPHQTLEIAFPRPVERPRGLRNKVALGAFYIRCGIAWSTDKASIRALWSALGAVVGTTTTVAPEKCLVHADEGTLACPAERARDWRGLAPGTLGVLHGPQDTLRAILAAGACGGGACSTAGWCKVGSRAALDAFVVTTTAQKIGAIGAGEVARAGPIKRATDGSVGTDCARGVVDLVCAFLGVLAGGAGGWACALHAAVVAPAEVETCCAVEVTAFFPYDA